MRILRTAAFLLFLSLPGAVEAGDQLHLIGDVIAYDGRVGHGQITISTGGITIEKSGLFSKQSRTYSLTEISSIRIERGVFKLRVLIVLGDETERSIEIQTSPKYYDEIRELLKDKLRV